MALQGSGEISMNDLRTEFGLSGQIDIGAFLSDGAATLPTSGQIRMNDFYNVIARSADLTHGTQPGSPSYPFYGYSQANIVNATSYNGAFGSLSKTDGLITSRPIKSISGQAFPAFGTPSINIFVDDSSGTSGGFTNFKTCTSLPFSSATTTATLARTAISTYAGPPPDGNTYDYDKRFYWPSQSTIYADFYDASPVASSFIVFFD